MSEKPVKRDLFSSKFGVIAAAAGSAVGLGNIWKFPYITGVYGGAAFLFVYLGFILAIGLPVMLSELIIGRSSKRNAFGAFKVLAPGTPWRYIGILGVSAAFLILSFYGVVAGWSLQYIILSLQDGFSNKTPGQVSSLFTTLIESPIKPVLLQFGFMILTGAIVIIGVKKGIEKYAKILMPILVVILIVLCIKSVSLEGAKAGLRFLFKPDFSKLTGDGILSALGHAFFTLSLGMGTLITYGSYIDKNNNLVSTAINVTVADTVIAILAGVAIFPAVFAFGIEPGQGPGLIFVTLPNVFHQMPGGFIFSILFFVLLTVAALTSSISILEVVVAYFKEEFKLGRKSSTVLATVLISILGVFCSLSMGLLSPYTLFGLNFFDLMDWISANLLLPIGGLFIAVFVGWFFGRRKVKAEIAKGGSLNGIMLTGFMISVRFVAPIAITIVILYKMGLVKNISIIGILIIVLLISLILMIESMWIIFSKAGKPGWASIIPMYNIIVLLEIIGKPWWWLFLWMIPIFNIVWIIWSIDLMVKSFGKSSRFTIGIIFLGNIFMSELAYGESEYIGAVGKRV